MPRTKLGKWAGVSLACFFVFMILIIIGGNFLRMRPGDPLLVIPGICAAIAGIAAFVTGLVSLTRFKDRSFTVILAVVIGSLAVLIIIGEVVEGIVWRLTH